MAGDHDVKVPDRETWPRGRTGLVTKGELDGMYALVYPEAQGRWIIHAASDPKQSVGCETAHYESWVVPDDQTLALSLADLGVVWVAPRDEESRVEKNVFGFRDAWSEDGALLARLRRRLLRKRF